MIRDRSDWRLLALSLAAGVFLAVLAIVLVVWSKGLLRSARRTDCAVHANALTHRFQLELDQRLLTLRRGGRPAEAARIWHLGAEGVLRSDPPQSAPPPARLLEIVRTFNSAEPQPISDSRLEGVEPAHWIPAAALDSPEAGLSGVLLVWDVERVEARILLPMIEDSPTDYEVVLLPRLGTPDDLTLHVRGAARPPPPFEFWRLAVGLRESGKTRQLIRAQTWLLSLLALWLLLMLVGSLWLYTRRQGVAKVRTRAREQFLTRAYHELQTPLALMRAAAETVGRGAAERPQDISRCVDIILREEERLTRTVRRLLRYLRLESASEALSETAPLGAEVESTAEDHRAALEARGLALELDIAGFPPDRAAPRDLIGDTLAELLGNARKYAEGGTRVRVSLAVNGSASRLTVEDDGPGLAGADPEEIFAPWKGKEAKTGQRSGSGLGLALVREGLALVGGTIRCESAGVKGVRFVVEL